MNEPQTPKKPSIFRRLANIASAFADVADGTVNGNTITSPTSVTEIPEGQEHIGDGNDNITLEDHYVDGYVAVTSSISVDDITHRSNVDIIKRTTLCRVATIFNEVVLLKIVNHLKDNFYHTTHQHTCPMCESIGSTHAYSVLATPVYGMGEGNYKILVTIEFKDIFGHTSQELSYHILYTTVTHEGGVLKLLRKTITLVTPSEPTATFMHFATKLANDVISEFVSQFTKSELTAVNGEKSTVLPGNFKPKLTDHCRDSAPEAPS